MKAEVITLHTVYNYGTQLQMYATQEKLKQYFDEVTFIDYRRSDTYGRNFIRTFTKGNPYKIPVILPTILCWKYKFGKFQKQNIKFTEETYLCEEDFRNFQAQADVYFAGSDQIWNAGWNNGVLAPFYLSFVPDDKLKYAYASSFGRSRLNDDEVMTSKRYIDRFNFITVREESGVKILNKQYQYQNAYRILDPTLAMPPEFWRAVESEKKIKKEYILIYNLQRSRAFDQYASELSRRTGIKLYRLCTRLDQVLKNGTSILIPDIFEFVSLIDHAKYVLTDSFHATAFSMNLGTEPICIYPSEYSGRIDEFLKLVGEEQRHIRNYKDYDVINRHVNWTRVQKVLEKERVRTDIFLKNVVENVMQA